MVSPVLDLLTDVGSTVAHYFRHKTKVVVAEAATQVAACATSLVYSAFVQKQRPRKSSTAFQVLRLTRVTLPQTLIVESPALTAQTIQYDFTTSLTYMYLVLPRVQSDDRAKHLACYPICFVKGLINAWSSGGLIFPRLTLNGFIDGGLAVERRVAKLYLDALKLSIEELHAAGVVHGDLYPSSII